MCYLLILIERAELDGKNSLRNEGVPKSFVVAIVLHDNGVFVFCT